VKVHWDDNLVPLDSPKQFLIFHFISLYEIHKMYDWKEKVFLFLDITDIIIFEWWVNWYFPEIIIFILFFSIEYAKCMIANNLNPSGIAASCAEKLSVKFAEIQACPTLLGSGGKWLMDYIGSTDRFQPVLWGVIFFLLFRFVLSGLNLLNLSTTAGDLFGLDWSITTGFYQCFFFVGKFTETGIIPLCRR